MDLLRNLGSAAVSSLVQKSGLNLPFSLGEKNLFYEGKTIWSLYDATKRDDNTPVSVFIFSGSQPSRRNLLPLAKNALRKLRTVRHPDILKFIDAVEQDPLIYIVTERVKPLGQTLGSTTLKGTNEKEDWNMWGLHRISTALAFVNDSCASTHGNMCIDSVFLTASGEWKLGGFELLSNAKDDQAVLYTLGSILPDSSKYASPEVKKAGWSTLKEHHPSVADAYALGILIHCVFNNQAPLPATIDPPHPPPPLSSRGAIPTSLFSSYKRLLHPNAKSRLSPSAFLEMGMTQMGDGNGFFANNPFIRICTGLDEFSLVRESERTALLRSLKDAAPTLPPEFAAHRVLPSLVSALEYGGATANVILPIVLQLGVHAPPAEYPAIVLTPVTKLFASPDRGTRMALLEHLDEYVDKLDNKTVADKIWPHLQTGFTDTVSVIREATVKSIGSLYPKFNDRILNNDLLRHLAKMQSDPEATIRTNTCILIGRLAPSLGYNTKRKVLVPAFVRALKDTFVHARVAGLMAFMATIDLFDPEELATKVLSYVSSALVDKEKLVRDQAFKAVELFVKKLEVHAATMPETVVNVNEQSNVSLPVTGSQNVLVSSAAGAASTLAGWAMASITKKLAPADLQTTIASLERPISAPPTPSSNDSTSLAATLVSTTTSPAASALSSPGQTAKVFTLGKGKGMQLGGGSSLSSSRRAATLAAELGASVDEASGSNTLPWGTDDLMDMHADEGDWTDFASAPTITASLATASSSVPATSFARSTSGLGFGDVPSAVNESEDWGALDYSEKNDTASGTLGVEGGGSDTGSTLRDAKDAWGGIAHPPRSPSLSPRMSALSSSAGLKFKASPQPARSVSPSPHCRSSPLIVSVSLSTPPTPRSPVPPTLSATASVLAPSSASMVGMTKEEKVAELARRKEERKQRIAALKEHKKQSAAKLEA